MGYRFGVTLDKREYFHEFLVSLNPGLVFGHTRIVLLNSLIFNLKLIKNKYNNERDKYTREEKQVHVLIKERKATLSRDQKWKHLPVFKVVEELPNPIG